MIMVRFWSAPILLCLWYHHSVSSFVQQAPRNHHERRSHGTMELCFAAAGSGITASSSSSDEERAAALSNYLAKAHIEKIKAIQEVEAKSQAKINALEQEIQNLKQESKSDSSSKQSSAMVTYRQSVDPRRIQALEDLSQEELMIRILQYQDQMQNYMVKSLAERSKAVANAEAAAQQKLAETLQLLNPTNDLYQARNAAVGRAGDKSRWGSAEVARVSSKTPAAVVDPPKKILPSSRAVFGGGAAPPPKLVSSEVIHAADHGLRADGGVNGPSLAERLAQGSNLDGVNRFYDKRNAKIQKSASKSRWGSQEVNRLEQPLGMAPRETLMFTAKAGFLPSSVATFNGMAAPPRFPTSEVALETIEAADHGLRADGGVGGLTLLERVTRGPNVGAQMVQNAAVQDHTESTLYTKRNDKVKSAAEKSRWGPQEIQKIHNRSDVGESTGAVSATALPGSSAGSTQQVDASIIQAADRGLRSDGSVDGPTLADRVATGYANLGAQLVAAAATSQPSSSSLYDIRNAKLMTAQGKSRWGGAEVKKVTSASSLGSIIGSPTATALPGKPIAPQQPVNPEMIQAADHGMRADGGVGGPSLADRVNAASANVGAQLVAAASTSLYERRNAKLKAAAGKSRWGPQELERIQSIGSLPAAATKVVGLDQRVNFGANLVMNQ